tara:strand:+ start:383 stop:610 length:228 start_codon:yes stop_codon:yes gene_type:complete
MKDRISIEINGIIQEGILATKDQIKEVSKKYNVDLDLECSCGEWYCTDEGYEMRCALANDNKCRWFIFSNSRCNP